MYLLVPAAGDIRALLFHPFEVIFHHDALAPPPRLSSTNLYFMSHLYAHYLLILSRRTRTHINVIIHTHARTHAHRHTDTQTDVRARARARGNDRGIVGGREKLREMREGEREWDSGVEREERGGRKRGVESEGEGGRKGNEVILLEKYTHTHDRVT